MSCFSILFKNCLQYTSKKKKKGHFQVGFNWSFLQLCSLQSWKAAAIFHWPAVRICGFSNFCTWAGRVLDRGLLLHGNCAQWVFTLTDWVSRIIAGCLLPPLHLLLWQGHFNYSTLIHSVQTGESDTARSAPSS